MLQERSLNHTNMNEAVAALKKVIDDMIEGGDI